MMKVWAIVVLSNIGCCQCLTCHSRWGSSKLVGDLAPRFCFKVFPRLPSGINSLKLGSLRQRLRISYRDFDRLLETTPEKGHRPGQRVQLSKTQQHTRAVPQQKQGYRALLSPHWPVFGCVLPRGKRQNLNWSISANFHWRRIWLWAISSLRTGNMSTYLGWWLLWPYRVIWDVHLDGPDYYLYV